MSSTPNTGEDWGSLLGVLTGEELNRYGQLAQDQISRERRWRWFQMTAGGVAITLAVWTFIPVFRLGPEHFKWFPLGLTTVLSYWPYRGLKTRRLWQEHYDAVQEELARRQV